MIQHADSPDSGFVDASGHRYVQARLVATGRSGSPCIVAIHAVCKPATVGRRRWYGRLWTHLRRWFPLSWNDLYFYLAGVAVGYWLASW